MKERIVVIDPDTAGSTSAYDSGMLSKINLFKVDYFCSTDWDRTHINTVKMHFWFNYQKYKNPIKKALSYIRSYSKILKFIKNNHPKIVHVIWHKLRVVDSFVVLYLKRKKIKSVFTAHNIVPHDSGNKYKRWYQWYYNQVDSIIVHSEQTKTELISEFGISPLKVSVIRHGIIKADTKIVDVLERKRVLEKEYALNNKIVFSSLGFQSLYKGIDIIINIWKNTPELYSNEKCHLIIIGKNYGIDFKELKECKNVTIIDDYVSLVDFDAYLLLSSAVLLPYRQISQSGVLFSAINYNIPVIVSNVGGLPEPLKFGKIGWNIGEATCDNLKNILLQLIQTPSTIFEVKERTEEFEKVKKEYSWDVISKKTESLYLSLLDKHKYNNLV